MKYIAVMIWLSSGKPVITELTLGVPLPQCMAVAAKVKPTESLVSVGCMTVDAISLVRSIL